MMHRESLLNAIAAGVDAASAQLKPGNGSHDVADCVPHGATRRTGKTTIGTLIGVSLGPGAPGLITRDAWAQLQRRDAAWVYPARSGKTPSYAFDIVSRARLQPPEEHAQLLFPMTHNGEKLAAAWLKAAHAILPWLEAGKDVLFLVEGDASTYATFGHLARTVQQLDADIPVRTIAGVNSFTSACADAGIALAEQDDTIAIIPAAYGVSAIDRHLKDFDTLVLMKIKPLLNELLDWLEQRDLLEEAWFIERSGAEDERHLSGRELLTLRDTKISYLSLMIIKHPHRVRGERIKGCLKKDRAVPADTAAAAGTDVDANANANANASNSNSNSNSNSEATA